MAESFNSLKGMAGEKFRLAENGVRFFGYEKAHRTVFMAIEAPVPGQEGVVKMQSQLPPYAVIEMLTDETYLKEKVQ